MDTFYFIYKHGVQNVQHTETKNTNQDNKINMEIYIKRVCKWGQTETHSIYVNYI